MTVAQQQAVIRQHAAHADRLRSRLLELVRRLFLGLDDYRDAQANHFAEQVTPLVVGAQVSMAALVDTYLASLLTAILGEPVPAVGVDLPDALRGVDPVEVYRRPFEQVWTELANGKSMTDAVTEGARRVESLAGTDLQLAKRHAAREALAAHEQVVGYRRVLIGEEDCGLCVVASTQRYRKAELLPIHPGCNCEIAPIIGDQDPGHIINGEVLEAAHAAIADRFGADAADRGARNLDYRKVLLVRDHGELGPTLTVAGHSFTGPDDIPA